MRLTLPKINTLLDTTRWYRHSNMDVNLKNRVTVCMTVIMKDSSPAMLKYTAIQINTLNFHIWASRYPFM